MCIIVFEREKCDNLVAVQNITDQSDRTEVDVCDLDDFYADFHNAIVWKQ